ncbi:porin [Rhodopseudomonas boonkerdii]|uniref:porin n=1 Tax=Rhodopseudomonas boonkerdii TaxID=475937 RepID=UPI001E5AB551|nr:porin [Rhodopseudomonas boonkerdii]UGV25030.1 porin [Rhodopseudomonas boonkerdii]
MTKLKSLVLGSAAGLIAIGGAQAADLPVKAKAVEYVKVCSLYGAGFYYIPGTDTCIKIGGAIRLDTAFGGSTYDVPFWQGGAGGAGAFTQDYFVTRERINLTTDTRTATEYGVVRTYANIQFDFLQNRESIAGGYTEVDYAFIQFAGFTFGKAVSQFDPQWALSKPYISSGFNAGSNNATGIPQIAYTASFGNGVSGTISLENASPYRNAGLWNTDTQIIGPFGATAPGYGTVSNNFAGNAYGGNHIPDVVGNLRLDQAWGTLHFGAAMHAITPTFYATAAGAAGNASLGHADDSYGFAVTGAVEFKNLPTGAGDTLKLEASYAKGAAKYIFGGTTDTIGGGRYAKANANSIGFGYVLDGVYQNNGQIIQSEAWQVSAFYEHYWNPAWRTSVFGNYSHISYGDGNALMLAAFQAGRNNTGGVLSPGTTGNFDLGLAQIGTRTAWTPVQNLTLSAQFTYSRIEQNLNGTYTGPVTGRATPVGGYTLSNQNAYNGSVQILRSF